MKLNEIKNLKAASITESSIPSHIVMPLARILDDGKITDSVQLFTLAGLINMFKTGTMPWPRNLNFEFSVGADQIDAVRNLSDAEKVEITKWVLQQLQASGSYEEQQRCIYPNEPMSNWIKLVARKQD